MGSYQPKASNWKEYWESEVLNAQTKSVMGRQNSVSFIDFFLLPEHITVIQVSSSFPHLLSEETMAF